MCHCPLDALVDLLCSRMGAGWNMGVHCTVLCLTGFSYIAQHFLFLIQSQYKETATKHAFYF